MSPPGSEDVPLKRVISLPLLVFYGLGTILGAGIYALVGKVAGRAGMAAPLAFLVAAALAAFTALSYAELSSRFPRSAGEAVYVSHAFSRRWLTLSVGLAVVATGVVSAAAIANAFVGYFHVFLPWPASVVLCGLIVSLGLLAAWGVRASLRAAMVFTLIEVAGLLLVVWVARGSLPALADHAGDLVPGLDAGAWGGVFLAAFLAFYAFIGFEDMVNIAEEVKDPHRNLPRAIIIALAVATALYALIALTAVLAMPPEQLAASEAPLADIYARATGRRPTVITLVGLFAVTNGALVQIIMAARILYGLARAGRLPAALGRVSPRTRTPLLATGGVTLAVLVLALWFPLVPLAEATTFLILAVFTLVNVALLAIKRREGKPAIGPCYPRWIPVTGFLTCAGFVVLRVLALIGVIGS